jgi:hypothetical protein
MLDPLCICSDVNGLMEELGFPYPKKWRPFIDASKLSFTAFFVCKGNAKPSRPVAHSLAKKNYMRV